MSRQEENSMQPMKIVLVSPPARGALVPKYEVIEAKDIKHVMKLVGIQCKEDWETVVILGEGMVNVGAVARDQAKRLKPNALSLKGKFAIIGYERNEVDKGTLHRFYGLSGEQVTIVQTRLRREISREMVFGK